MRPFEVGDLIKVGNAGFDNIRMINGGKIYLLSGGYVYFDDIKTIRKPRKGGKEARDIVAMLAKEMLNTRRDARRYCLNKGMERTFKETLIFHEKTFEKYVRLNNAISMLVSISKCAGLD